MKSWAIANGESRRAEQILDQGDFKIPARESVLVQSATGTVDQQPEFSAAVGERRAGALAASRTWQGSSLRSSIRTPGLISRDRRSVLVQFDVKGPADKAKDKIAPILAAIAGVQSAHPSMIVEEFGQASADYQVGQRFERDMGRVELISLPLTIAILIFAFGALVAAGLPVILAFSAVLAATGLNSLVSHVVPTDAADAERDHPDDRHGGRDRLLAVLPAAGAGGATQGPVPARGPARSQQAPRGRRS